MKMDRILLKLSGEALAGEKIEVRYETCTFETEWRSSGR